MNKTQHISQSICNHIVIKRFHWMIVCLFLLLVTLISISIAPTAAQTTDIPTYITDGTYFELEGTTPDPLIDSATLEFLPLEAQVGTPNGNGWRHEYKIDESIRRPLGAHYERFEATYTVSMSDAAKSIIVQYHGDSPTLMKMYYADTEEDGLIDSVGGNGVFDLYVRLRTLGLPDFGEDVFTFGTLQAGDTFTVVVENNYGEVTVTAMGQSITRELVQTSADYLKFGNYLQAQYTTDATHPYGGEKCRDLGIDFPECYATLGITESSVLMTNVSYERIEDTTFVQPTQVPNATLLNGDFEAGLNDWVQAEPAAESGDVNGGLISAKIGIGGSVSQMVDLQPNTEYQLDVYVKGEGTTGAMGGDVNISQPFNESDWTLVSSTFTTGANPVPVQVFGAAGTTGDVRFDDFTLTALGSAPTSTEEPTTGGSSAVLNGDFEMQMSNWTQVEPVAESGDTYNGIVSAKVGTGGRVSQMIDLEPNTTYTFDVYVKGEGTAGVTNGGDVDVSEAFNHTDWTLVSATFITGANPDPVELFGAGGSSGDVRFDDFALYPAGSAPAVTATPNPTDPAPAPTAIPTPSDGSCAPIPGQIVDEVVWDLEGGDLPLSPLVDECTLVFDALAAMHTTPNGNGWRHEYKIKQELRVAMSETYEEFGATIRVDMSDGGKTIVAQHHASDTGTIMKLYVADSDEGGFADGANTTPGDGIFNVYVRILNESGSEEKQWLGNIESGDTFSFYVLNNFGFVEVSAFDKSFGIQVEDDTASYLKFGNYLQSQYPDGTDCGTHGDSDSFAQCYQDIGITDSVITMSDVTYVRTTESPLETPLAVGLGSVETLSSLPLLVIIVSITLMGSIAVIYRESQKK